jgi:hypothetical protein
MRIHPALSLVPAAGAVGAGVMSYNASIDIAKYLGYENASQYSINTKELNFMGIQDAAIGGALFIGFAAIARGVYLYSQDQKGHARQYLALGGGMLMAAGLYALTAGFFDLAIPSSKIGHFDNTKEASIFGTVYSVLVAIGGALMGTGCLMTKSNVKKVNVNQDNPFIGDPTLISSSDEKVARNNGVPHITQTYGTGATSNASSINNNQASTKSSWGGLNSIFSSSNTSGGSSKGFFSKFGLGG